MSDEELDQMLEELSAAGIAPDGRRFNCPCILYPVEPASESGL